MTHRKLIGKRCIFALQGEPIEGTIISIKAGVAAIEVDDGTFFFRDIGFIEVI